jgi:hypothetical protein
MESNDANASIVSMAALAAFRVIHASIHHAAALVCKCFQRNSTLQMEIRKVDKCIRYCTVMAISHSGIIEAVGVVHNC